MLVSCFILNRAKYTKDLWQKEESPNLIREI